MVWTLEPAAFGMFLRGYWSVAFCRVFAAYVQWSKLLDWDLAHVSYTESEACQEQHSS